MKKIQKILATLLTLAIVFSCTTTVLASSSTKNNTPILTLETNQYNSNGERHIKVTWTGDSGTYQIQIDDDSDFESPTTKKRPSKQGMYWNFVLNENVDATYYVRVRKNGGEWSNVVVAETDKLIEDEKEYPSYSFIPDLSKIDFSYILKNFDWSKIEFPKLTIKK